ncbi:hypothetical protein ACS0TY_013896 [Phlomoides rotata]
MASTSFLFSTHINAGRNFSAFSPPPLRNSLRVSAGYATAEMGAETSSKTASFYDLLGIQTGASCQEIKSAYRKLARTLHPDVASKYGGDSSSSAEDFMRVHAAYATLSDPEKRAMYDSSLFRRRRRPVVSGGYPEMTRRGRSWETDQCW